MPRKQPIAVAALALVFTYLFFAEYLPPFRTVHISYDLDGFHYSLADYGFQALKQGRFPEWDAAIYSGIGYASNVQAALFYPPTWVLFAANWSRDQISFQSLQWFIAAHIWLAFVMAYMWFKRGRRLGEMASVLGAGVFAFSGYPCLQWQHLGMISGYAWLPLALLGIDRAADQRRWQALWLVVAASALSFLAGYPPLWFQYVVVMIAYALAKGVRAALGTAAAVGASMAVVMVQLAPALSAASTKLPESRYGLGYKDPSFYLSYLIPNYFNFGIDVAPGANPLKEYLYLGAPALLGIAWLVSRRDQLRASLPIWAVLGASAVLLTNPFDLVRPLVEHMPVVREICRDWCSMAGLSLVAAALAAQGLDGFFARPARAIPKAMAAAALVGAAAWATWELLRWRSGAFAYGWRAAFEPAMTLVVFCLLAYAWRSLQGMTRTVLAAALILSAGADYKAFGTSKRFNAVRGEYKPTFTSASIAGMDDAAYRQMRAHADDRVAADLTLHPLLLRHVGLKTPQGFDPLLTTAYKDLLGQRVEFYSDREFSIDPDRADLLEDLGVRYFVTSQGMPLESRLRANPKYRLLEPGTSYYKVFESLAARPPYGWESAQGDVEPRSSIPEEREFLVRSNAGGRFALHEEFLPGWDASVDGKAVPLERWRGAFQAVMVPAGEHRVEFRYRTPGLRAGAWISLLSVLALGIATFVTRR